MQQKGRAAARPFFCSHSESAVKMLHGFANCFEGPTRGLLHLVLLLLGPGHHQQGRTGSHANARQRQGLLHFLHIHTKSLLRFYLAPKEGFLF